ncbi:MBOAT family O-acyltransferase [Hwanghaeella grinnelliae]|nr:MBOAT family protein [Hwanghaeella grinnelliae]
MIFAVSGVHAGLPAILLPLGISFFTFQQIAYLVDIYQGKTRSGSLLNYVFLISFFPQLIAGPIVHHSELIPQLGGNRFARFRPEDIAAGVILFSIGLAKKVLLADNLAVYADRLFLAQSMAVETSMIEAWLGMLCYTFQIYFDFSGYSDMALGLGLVFGLTLPVNFWSPYKATNIIDFWKRWNMTLSTFLRDYLYFPLGGNRSGPVRRYANLWIVMLLGGLWHGAGWQFVFWGALHGFYLTVAHLWFRHSRLRVPVLISTILTFIGVVFAWVFFRAENFAQAGAIVRAMTAQTAPGIWELAIYETADLGIALLAVSVALVWFMPNALQITERLKTATVSTRSSMAFAGVLGSLSAVCLFKVYVSGSNAFIYFQF